MKYDCIIIGIGIAGISTAIHLNKLNKNLKILIIDKYKFPRNKLCAGYLTLKSVDLLKELGIKVEKYDYRLVKGITISYKNKIRIKANNHGLYCQKLIDRTVLDYEMFKQLKKIKIDIKQTTQINDLNKEESYVLIDNIKYYYKYLIFADGQLGYSSKFNNERKKYFAMQMNFKQKEKEKIQMYFGITKKGYAWEASSGDYINIGFCDLYNKKTDYMKIFEDFVKQLGYKYNKTQVKGFYVPYGIKKTKIINNNIYLIGDAVGSVDPLTLAGISYAINTGKYVSKSIIKNNNKIYLNYLKKLQIKFRILKIMGGILYNKITLFIFIRVGGHFFGKLFTYILDRFILWNKGSFHE